MARERAASSFALDIHADPESLQAAFLRRSIAALERIAGSAPAKTLKDALAAPTDIGSLGRNS